MEYWILDLRHCQSRSHKITLVVVSSQRQLRSGFELSVGVVGPSVCPLVRSSGGLDVAYLDSPKWSHGFDVISHFRHSFASSAYLCKKKKWFLTISLALVGPIALICIC